MSLYDDIMDVNSALKKKPIELQMFKEIIERLNYYEEEAEVWKVKAVTLASAIKIVKELEED